MYFVDSAEMDTVRYNVIWRLFHNSKKIILQLINFKFVSRYTLPHISARQSYLQEKNSGFRYATHKYYISTTRIPLTLVDLQLDTQNSYLFIYNTYIKILYMFRALPCSSLGGLRRNCVYAASGIVTLCRWLSCAPVKKEASFLTGAQDSHLQTVTIPEAAYTQLRRRSSEDEQGNAWNM